MSAQLSICFPTSVVDTSCDENEISRVIMFFVVDELSVNNCNKYPVAGFPNLPKTTLNDMEALLGDCICRKSLHSS